MHCVKHAFAFKRKGGGGGGREDRRGERKKDERRKEGISPLNLTEHSRTTTTKGYFSYLPTVVISRT